MNYRNTLLAAGAAFAATAGLANAQYDFNWNQQGGGTNSTVAIAGPTLWTVLNQAAGGVETVYGGIGDSMRICYGVDATQGGTMWTNREWTNRWFRLIGAYANSNPTPGLDIGVFSIRSAATPSTDGDACFTPFVLQPSGVLYEDIAVEGVFGVVDVPGAFPDFWNVSFQWTDPLTGPTQLGEDPNLPGTPLLANVVLEVQGPIDEGPFNVQYYIANTGEGLGQNLLAPGGVANGLADYASGIFAGGPDPVATNAISHQRLTSFSETEGIFAPWTQPLAFGGGDPSDVIFRPGDLAFTTPRLWAQKNNNQGGGAADWRVSQAPVSVNNLQLRDTLAGAETAAGSSVQDPCLLPLTNISWFLWSATSANAMLQRPTSWSTLAVPFFPPQKGSFILGLIGTKRHGPQAVPIEFDTITQLFLGINAVSQGSPFTAAYDPDLDPTQPWQASLFQGGFEPITTGISGFGPGAFPLVASPTPSLGGAKLGVAGVGVQLSLCTGIVATTEFGTGLTLNLQ